MTIGKREVRAKRSVGAAEFMTKPVHTSWRGSCRYPGQPNRAFIPTLVNFREYIQFFNSAIEQLPLLAQRRDTGLRHSLQYILDHCAQTPRNLNQVTMFTLLESGLRAG
jgi:hypothetical protein